MKITFRGFIYGISSAPTLILAAVMVSVTLYGTLVTWAGTDASAWVVLLSSLGTSQSIIVFGLLWWLVRIHAVAKWATNELVLVRSGSRVRALGGAVALALGELLATGLVIAIVSIASAPWRWHNEWHFSGGDQAIESFFTRPLTALLATGVYAAVAFMLVAILLFSVALRHGAQWAIGVSAVIYAWAAMSSFGVTDDVAVLDISRAFTLPWALTTGSFIFPLLLLAVAAFIAFRRVRVLDHFAHRRSWFAFDSRLAVLLPMLLSFVFAALAFVSMEHATQGELVVAFFAGDGGDLVLYLAAMGLILTGATVAIAPSVSSAEDRYTEESIRDGSARRWFTRHAVVWFLRSFAISAGIVLAVLAAALIVQPGTMAADLSRDAFIVFVRVAVQVFFYASLGQLLLWVAPIAVAWPTTIATALVLGYPFVLDLGDANVFAAFSTIHEGLPAIADWNSIYGAFACAVAAVIATAMRATTNRSPSSVRYQTG